MLPVTSSQNEFITDLKAVMNISDNRALTLCSAMKNIICHNIIEQRLEGVSDEFRINVPPIGYLTLYKDSDDRWNIKDFVIDEAFKKSLNQSLRSKESLLYQQNKDWITTLVQNQIKTLSQNY